MRERRLLEGQSVVELALVVPLMTLLLVGAVDLGRLFYAKVTVANAARVAAEFATNTNVLVTSNNNVATAQTKVKERAVNEAGGQHGMISASDVTFTGNFTPGATFTVVVTTQFRPMTPLVSTLMGAGSVSVSHRIEARFNCTAANLAAGTCVYPTPTP